MWGEPHLPRSPAPSTPNPPSVIGERINYHHRGTTGPRRAGRRHAVRCLPITYIRRGGGGLSVSGEAHQAQAAALINITTTIIIIITKIL